MKNPSKKTQEVRARIEQARGSSEKMRKLVCRRELSLKCQLRIIRCYVLPVLFYGIEGWTLTKKLEGKLEGVRDVALPPHAHCSGYRGPPE